MAPFLQSLFLLLLPLLQITYSAIMPMIEKQKRILQKIKLFFKRLYEIFPKDPEICFATAKL